MTPSRHPVARVPFELVIVALLVPGIACAASGTPPGVRPPWAASAARPSAALERMLRDELEAGVRLPEAVIQRFGLDRHDDLGELLEQQPEVARPTHVAGPGVNLAPDRLANDRSGDPTCP